MREGACFLNMNNYTGIYEWEISKGNIMKCNFVDGVLHGEYIMEDKEKGIIRIGMYKSGVLEGHNVLIHRKWTEDTIKRVSIIIEGGNILPTIVIEYKNKSDSFVFKKYVGCFDKQMLPEGKGKLYLNNYGIIIESDNFKCDDEGEIIISNCVAKSEDTCFEYEIKEQYDEKDMIQKLCRYNIDYIKHCRKVVFKSLKLFNKPLNNMIANYISIND